MRQTSFQFINNYKKEFGGSLLTGKRKTARPLSFKNPTHLILKSTGSHCFVPDSRKIERIINSQANKYGIKLYKLSLNWSHIHMVMLLPSKKAYLAFIRTLTSLLVSLLSKLKGKSLKGLFNLRPFTRILSWGRDFRNVINYHELNDMEARGFKRTKKKSKNSTDKPKTHEEVTE
ncbi:MAG: hypothetical protein JSU04_04515 [Bdellovibrionales bacterium]|nr:hypothetical protein [Bdellovibrionales bacterium]